MINTNYYRHMTQPAPQTRTARGRPRSFDRDLALEKAMRVFWEKGFAATSMTDLTTAMGIAPPSLYAAFGSKEDLYAEALDLYDQRARTLTEDIYSQGPSLRDQIEASLRLSARIDGKDVPTGCMVMMACEQSSELSEELQDRLSDKRCRGTDMLKDRLKRAVETGELRADADVEGLSQFYSVLQRGLALSGRVGIEPDDMETAIAKAMQAWDRLTAA